MTILKFKEIGQILVIGSVVLVPSVLIDVSVANSFRVGPWSEERVDNLGYEQTKTTGRAGVHLVQAEVSIPADTTSEGDSGDEVKSIGDMFDDDPTTLHPPHL